MRLFFSHLISHAIVIACFLMLPTGAYTQDITVTIKPLHSIVSNVTKGINEPVLLMDESISAHYYRLKPYDKLAIANAKQIFWFGSNIETLFNFDANEKAVSILNIKTLKKHKLREIHNHSKSHKNDTIDPHIWLDTHNAIRIAKAVTDKLSELDKKNAVKYKHNVSVFIKKINQLNQYLQTEFADVQNQPFATLHDAFQYIEKQHGLNHIGNISLHPKLPLSGKQRVAINHTIQAYEIQCIFYDPYHHPKAAQQLGRQENIRLQALDAIGYRLEKGPDLYFDLLKNLAKDIKSCLK